MLLPSSRKATSDQHAVPVNDMSSSESAMNVTGFLKASAIAPGAKNKCQ
jgi:hypothetical protein